VPLNPERVLSVIHAPIQTPSPRLQPQATYTTATPHTITELEQQVELVKQHLKRRRTQSPPSPSELALDQLVKGCQIAMHGAVVLAMQNKQLIAENHHQKRKRAKKRRYIARGGIYTRAEAQDLINQVDNSQEEAEIRGQEEARPRAPPRCSLYTSLEHKANKCPGRQGAI
jgi:hypothetical protein